MTRSVLKLLEENRKTIQSLNQNNTTNNNAPSSTRMDHNMTTVQERTVQEIIEDILEQEQWRNQRASKLDLDDFLSLLVEFNSHGIHFS
jgi:16S rRNA A1518/A1519 N6-dimethyltransferase RsmA/KsgA/DIM1 with predicted DNA glycosylase/AP lyase activity